MSADLVSVHGGHSGEFCCHADDTLEKIVQAYIDHGFTWVGISEHMPPTNDSFLFPDEVEAGFDAESLAARFQRYFPVARELQRRHADQIELFVGFETEMWTGALDAAKRIIAEHRPDYIVGSVHHVRDHVIDGTPDWYTEAAEAVGGLDELYCEYFDQQLEVIETLTPAVVAHFDLIRHHDPDYAERLLNPPIMERIERNLERIRTHGLIIDYNVRALAKGAEEPFVSRPILERAKEMGIAVVPGDDSHRVSGVGAHVQDGIRILEEMGFDTNWKRPGRATPD